MINARVNFRIRILHARIVIRVVVESAGSDASFAKGKLAIFEEALPAAALGL